MQRWLAGSGRTFCFPRVNSWYEHWYEHHFPATQGRIYMLQVECSNNNIRHGWCVSVDLESAFSNVSYFVRIRSARTKFVVCVFFPGLRLFALVLHLGWCRSHGWNSILFSAAASKKGRHASTTNQMMISSCGAVMQKQKERDRREHVQQYQLSRKDCLETKHVC